MASYLESRAWYSFGGDIDSMLEPTSCYYIGTPSLRKNILLLELSPSDSQAERVSGYALHRSTWLSYLTPHGVRSAIVKAAFTAGIQDKKTTTALKSSILGREIQLTHA